jgi:hypothetical protein
MTGAASRRDVLEGGLLAVAAASGTTVTAIAPAQAAEGVPSDQFKTGQLKFVSLLARKEGLTREGFKRAWLIDHVELAYACPGILRYTLTVVEQTSTRRDVAGFDLEIDGIAELYFADRAAFDLYNTSPETKKLRDHGATFIGRQINFVTREKVAIPRAI